MSKEISIWKFLIAQKKNYSRALNLKHLSFLLKTV